MTKMFHRTARLSGLMFGLLVSAPAFAAEAQTLTHDGITYVYSVTEKGTAKIIEGVDQTNNRNFRLYVSRGWVDGRVDGASVSFSLRDVKPIAAVTTVATVTTPTKIAAR